MENLVFSIFQPFPKLQIVDCIHRFLTINEVVAKNILKALFVHKEGIETIRYEQNAKQVVQSVPFCLTLLMHLSQNPKYVYCWLPVAILKIASELCFFDLLSEGLLEPWIDLRNIIHQRSTCFVKAFKFALGHCEVLINWFDLLLKGWALAILVPLKTWIVIFLIFFTNESCPEFFHQNYIIFLKVKCQHVLFMHFKDVFVTLHKYLNVVSQKILLSFFPVYCWLFQSKSSGSRGIGWNLFSWRKFSDFGSAYILPFVLLTIHDYWRFGDLRKMSDKYRVFSDLCEVNAFLRIELKDLFE